MKKHDIRLLCLDIDGTLLDSRHRLPPENRAAVRKAEQAGIPVCLMSARPPGAVFPIMEELGISGPVVCYNGGLILKGNEPLYDCRVSTQAALGVLQEAERRNISLSVYRDMIWYISTEDRWNAEESTITGLLPVVTKLRTSVRSWQKGAHKLLCMGEPERIDELEAELSARNLPVQLVRSKDTYLEILPEQNGKAAAMRILCRRMNILPKYVMAIGDHDNDCGMLQAAAYGIAMGNASKAAKQAARYITRTNDEAGVADAIHRWIFGGEQ